MKSEIHSKQIIFELTCADSILKSYPLTSFISKDSSSLSNPEILGFLVSKLQAHFSELKDLIFQEEASKEQEQLGYELCETKRTKQAEKGQETAREGSTCQDLIFLNKIGYSALHRSHKTFCEQSLRLFDSLTSELQSYTESLHPQPPNTPKKAQNLQTGHTPHPSHPGTQIHPNSIKLNPKTTLEALFGSFEASYTTILSKFQNLHFSVKRFIREDSQISKLKLNLRSTASKAIMATDGKDYLEELDLVSWKGGGDPAASSGKPNAFDLIKDKLSKRRNRDMQVVSEGSKTGILSLFG